MSTTCEVRVEGWFYWPREVDIKNKIKGKPFDLNRYQLPSELFIYSVKRFNPYNLELTQLKRVIGSIFNPTLVRGVIDLQSSILIPFFIKEENVEVLGKILDQYRYKDYLVV